MIRTGIDDLPQPLRLREHRHDDTIVVTASGEIDVSSADELRSRLAGQLGRCRRLVLDLREVDFIDSSGLHRILEVALASRAGGVDFALVPGPPPVQRLFELTKTAERLRFIAPVERPGRPGE